MRVAITGATGYLGSCIAGIFCDHGHEVLSLSRRPSGENWIPYSLRDDPRQLPLDGVDALIHAAYDFAPRQWQEIIGVNVDPGIALFQAAAAAHVRKIIFISSMSSFDGCLSKYGRAKRMVEKEVLNLGAMVVRPGLVWGERPGGVMGALERAVATLPVIPFPSGGTNPTQFLIHQTDLAESLVVFAQSPPPSDRALQSLAHSEPLSLRAILQTIANRRRLTRTLMPVPSRCVMAGLKAAEMLGLAVPFRSDSLVGLLHGNPDPEIEAPPAGTEFRPFV